MTEIEPASPAHTGALAAIHAACFPPTERWDAAVIATQLSLPGTLALIAPGGGMILARAIAGEAEILTLAVIPARRQQGLGRALLIAAMTEAARRGAAVMFLEVAAANARARALYAAAGFRPVGRRPRYYANGGDAVTMAKDL
ncbi:MAG: GNAT family N-acetyltransferase [Acidibrevibacterium sp.]|uniref:GNAT family N-acetyltransferase n=1 Tax=Acidibrevibacterium sp. TaxID=2606776 RepID=UPI003D01324D